MPGGPVAIAAGDFTGNGEVDLAVAEVDEHGHHLPGQRRRDIHALADNRSLGGEQSAVPRTRSWRATSPSNGISTWPSPTADTDDVTVLLGNGRRHVPAFRRRSLRATFQRVALFDLSLVAGDFLNNGLTDLAVATTDFGNGRLLDVLLGNGDGTFQAPE